AKRKGQSPKRGQSPPSQVTVPTVPGDRPTVPGDSSLPSQGTVPQKGLSPDGPRPRGLSPKGLSPDGDGQRPMATPQHQVEDMAASRHRSCNTTNLNLLTERRPDRVVCRPPDRATGSGPTANRPWIHQRRRGVAGGPSACGGHGSDGRRTPRNSKPS